MTDQATQIAGATYPCKLCKGSGLEYWGVSPDGGDTAHPCPGCKGTGKVDALPGLKEPCPDEECQKTNGYVKWAGAPYLLDGDIRFVKHPECQGRVWIPAWDLAKYLRAGLVLNPESSWVISMEGAGLEAVLNREKPSYWADGIFEEAIIKVLSKALVASGATLYEEKK